MGVEWVSLLQSIVFTRINNEFSSKLKTDYNMTDINFAKKKKNPSDPIFPYVSVLFLPALERGRDLEGKTINAGLFTLQIDVTDNKSQTRAKEVAFEILRIMKGMGFEVIAMPSFEDTEDTHRSTARYRRSICEDDILSN